MTARIWHEVSGQGEDLVLIHGWGMNASVWNDLLPLLRPKYRVTVLDLPGHGRSAHLIFDGLASMTEQVLDVLPEKAVLLGWSMGGLVALSLASSYPARFSRVRLVAASPCFVRRQDWSAAQEGEVFDNFGQGLEEDYPKTLRRFLNLQLKGAEDARGLARNLGAGLEAEAPDRAALLKGLSLLKSEDLRDKMCLQELDLAVLLGERDTLVPRHLELALKRLCSEIDVEVLKGAGHLPFVTHQDQFLTWLEQKMHD